MPSLPDIPGKSLVSGSGQRAGKIAAGAGLAMIAVGGYVVRRLIRRGRVEEGAASADPIAETPTAPPGAEAEGEPQLGREKTPKPAGEKPPAPKPAPEPGDISKDREPHHALNNPVGEPDPTEWPDPYEQREDPRDPADPDAEPFGEEPHAPTNAESTSEPHPSEDPEAGDRATPPKRDKLDD